ncbi:MAG: cellulose-binding protein, partial [Actinobacteria bacterium]|nr:cellulose-binding protein [Actinomycetota bacterium]
MGLAALAGLATVVVGAAPAWAPDTPGPTTTAKPGVPPGQVVTSTTSPSTTVPPGPPVSVAPPPT